jgi:hypothetical protein
MHRIIKLSALAGILALLAHSNLKAQSLSQGAHEVLWYRTPAPIWDHALPMQWSEGSINCVHVRGNATLAMRWKAGKIVSMTYSEWKILLNQVPMTVDQVKMKGEVR